MITKNQQSTVLAVRFILYSIIGFSGVAIDFIVFYILVNFLNFHYIPANIISSLSGASNNFLLNAKFNFKVNNKKILRYTSFITVACLGTACSSLTIFILERVWKLIYQ